MNYKYLNGPVLLLILSNLLVSCTTTTPNSPVEPPVNPSPEPNNVVEANIGANSITNKDVIDGDTLRINGIKYRLACVDAPEVAHPAYNNKPTSPNQPGGQEAREALINIIMANGGIQPGVNLGTSYGRTVSTLTTLTNNQDVALLLAQQGWVVVSNKYRDCPNIAELDAAQLSAQTNRLGIWVNGTNIQTPEEFRRSH